MKIYVAQIEGKIGLVSVRVIAQDFTDAVQACWMYYPGAKLQDLKYEAEAKVADGTERAVEFKSTLIDVKTEKTVVASK